MLSSSLDYISLPILFIWFQPTYRLHLGKFNGTIANEWTGTGLTKYINGNNMAFSTVDNDQDNHYLNCAAIMGKGYNY